MKVFRLNRRQTIPITLEQAWEFFSNPSNLAKITPPKMKFIIKGEKPSAMFAGQIIAYEICPFGNFPLTWVTEITHVDKPHYFIDEQRFGPYKMWHHIHRFKENAGQVEIEDEIYYVLPFGLLSDMINSFIVKGQLEKIFLYRREVIEKIFNASQRS